MCYDKKELGITKKYVNYTSLTTKRTSWPVLTNSSEKFVVFDKIEWYKPSQINVPLNKNLKFFRLFLS
jgi:hypothetical protein